MLLNIISQPLEEYFLCGTRQAEDFQLLKKQCYAGWTSALNRSRVWTVPYMAKKLALLLVLHDQVDSEKKVRASSRVGEASPTENLQRPSQCMVTFLHHNTKLVHIDELASRLQKNSERGGAVPEAPDTELNVLPLCLIGFR
jgi:hypothetical protein